MRTSCGSQMRKLSYYKQKRGVPRGMDGSKLQSIPKGESTEMESSDEDCRTALGHHTEIPEIDTASPWEYLAEVAGRYDNVTLDRSDALYFEERSRVPPDLAEGMRERGCVVEWVCGQLVQFD